MSSDRRLRTTLLVTAALSLLAAVLTPFAPVHQDRVELSWTAPEGPAAVAMPLLPYQPTRFEGGVPCSGVDDAVLLRTVPAQVDDGAPSLPGLTVVRTDGRLVVTSYGVVVADADVEPGPCELSIESDPGATVVRRSGSIIGSVTGDVRPAVVEITTDTAAGASVRVLTDNRFQTSPTPLKWVLVGLCVLAFLASVLTLARLDRRATHRAPRLVSRRWWRPRAVDAVVVAVLAGWAAIGPITIDDGYITGIVRSRESNGFVGNVYRWMNAPEAPFAWFYEFDDRWSQISTAAVWMRVPSTVLALLTWLVVSRAVLPRLGVFAHSRRSGPIAALAFGCWWLPFNLGLRSESWVALGTVVVFVLVERGLATRRVSPFVVGLAVAGLTVATAPSGIVAFAPYLAALPAGLRALRSRTDLHRAPLLLILAAAPAVAVPLMFADQTLAAVLEATRVRTLIGGDLAWYQEIQRYYDLLDPAGFQGALQRRVPVLLALAGVVATWWRLRRGSVPGVASGPALRLLGSVLVALLALALAPTKWTYHFGGLAGIGAAALVVTIHAWSRVGLARSAPTSAAGGTAVLAVGAGLALAGRNEWPSVSNLNITWGTIAPLVLGVPISDIVLIGGLLLAAVLAAPVIWSAARPSGSTGTPAGEPMSRIPSPGALALLLVIAVVGLQLASVARAAYERRNTYSLATDTAAALTGGTCGMADRLRVETDPAAGLLRPRVPAAPDARDGFTPDPGATSVAGTTLPGWRADTERPSTITTDWFALDPGDPPGLPLVVTVEGTLDERSGVAAEFGTVDSDGTVAPITAVGFADTAGTPTARDLRVDRLVAPDADVVRLVARADGGPDPLVFSPPRAPRTVPWSAVVPSGTTALVDWPVAFLFPCVRPAPLVDGTASVPGWRVAVPRSDAASAAIVDTPRTGGPFAASRMLVDQQRLPTYLDGDPFADLVTLYRWAPRGDAATPTVTREPTTVIGWSSPGRITVPPLDPPG